MEFSIGDTKIIYDFESGCNINVTSDIDSIIGSDEVIVISDVISSKYEYNAYEVDNLQTTFDSFKTLNAKHTIFIDMISLKSGLSHRSLEAMFKTLGFVDISNMYVNEPSSILMVLNEGKGRLVGSIAIADRYMENANFSLMPICVYHVSAMQEYASLEGKFNELVIELHDALEKTVHEFNEKHTPSKYKEEPVLTHPIVKLDEVKED